MDSAAAAAVTDSTPALKGLPHPAAKPEAERRSRPPLRSLALPTEHGGWGFLFEPIVLGLAVAPSAGGALVALAAILGFLARQPLRLAMQDAVRGRRYPRTFWCRLFASTLLAGATLAMSAAVWISGWMPLIPFAIVAPLASIALVFDARNRSRAALAEYAGTIAMASTAAAIPIAAGWTLAQALVPMALVVLRGVPTVMYVRTLLTRAHKKIAASWPAMLAHAVAIPLALLATASWLAAALMLVLFGRATWGLTHPIPRAKTIGWSEIAWGTFAVAVLIVAIRVSY